MQIKIDKTHMGCFGKQDKKIEPKAIVIHHTATTSPKRTRKALMNKGCSTHFEVDKDGTIWQYREEDRMCSHCGSANIHAIGIDVTHMEHAKFPPEQVRAVQDLVEYLCDKWKIPHVVNETLSGIYPHRALGNTVCPDNFPMDYLNYKEFTAYMSDTPIEVQNGVTKDFDGYLFGRALKYLYTDEALTTPMEYDDRFEYELGFYCPCTGRWIKYPSIQTLDAMPDEIVMEDPQMGRVIQNAQDGMRIWYVSNLINAIDLSSNVEITEDNHIKFAITTPGYESYNGTLKVFYKVHGGDEQIHEVEDIMFANGVGVGTVDLSESLTPPYVIEEHSVLLMNVIMLDSDKTITIRAKWIT